MTTKGAHLQTITLMYMHCNMSEYILCSCIHEWTVFDVSCDYCATN